MAATEQKEACFEMGPETHAIPMTLFSNNRYGTVPAFCRTTLYKGEHSVVRRAYFSLTHFLDLVGWFVAPGIILSRMRLNHCGLQLTVCGVVV